VQATPKTKYKNQMIFIITNVVYEIPYCNSVAIKTTKNPTGYGELEVRRAIGRTQQVIKVGPGLSRQRIHSSSISLQVPIDGLELADVLVTVITVDPGGRTVPKRFVELGRENDEVRGSLVGRYRSNQGVRLERLDGVLFSVILEAGYHNELIV